MSSSQCPAGQPKDKMILITHKICIRQISRQLLEGSAEGKEKSHQKSCYKVFVDELHGGGIADIRCLDDCGSDWDEIDDKEVLGHINDLPFGVFALAKYL